MPEPAIPQAGWTTVAFGDVVRLSTERSSNPDSDGFERFVGLEHIEPGDLRIRRWGDIADGTTFTSVFRPGQVLFGKRRAYQRKVAVADFSGVCSGDIYVLEPRGKDLLPELLPFICQTDAFLEHAVGTSAGSLSPRTNWTSLSGFEFALPPIEEQRRLVEMLVTASAAEERYRELLLATKLAEEAVFYHRLFDRDVAHTGGSVPNDWDRLRPECPMVPINELADVAYGISAAVSQNTQESIGWPILTGANISLDGTLSLHKLVYHPAPRKSDFKLRKGDVLLNWRSGSAEHVGKAALFDLDGDWTFASFILRVRVGSRMDNRFLWRLLNFMRERQLFGKSISQQINFKMNATYFRSVEIPCPSTATQELIVDELSELWRGISQIDSRTDGLRALRNLVLPRRRQ